jgi:hypothetical protein
MGMHPRWFRANRAYSQTQRTVDRQFLLRPSKAIRNIIGASAARAQRTHPVKIYWLEANINHEHIGIAALSDSPEHLNNLVKFKRTYHRLLAEEVNRLHGRDGALFSSRAHITECVDDESIEQQFFYALTNPVKDGLVDRVVQWDGLSSYGALARGETESFVYYDRTAWNKAGGKRGKRPLQAFARSVSIVYSPLPAWEGMPAGQRETHIRREIRGMEKAFREERELAGRGCVGPARLEKTDPRDRPAQLPVRTPKPLCHAASAEAARAYNEEFREFLKSYGKASVLYRSGMFDVEFPAGSIKPPLLDVCVPGG